MRKSLWSGWCKIIEGLYWVCVVTSLTKSCPCQVPAVAPGPGADPRCLTGVPSCCSDLYVSVPNIWVPSCSLKHRFWTRCVRVQMAQQPITSVFRACLFVEWKAGCVSNCRPEAENISLQWIWRCPCVEGTSSVSFCFAWAVEQNCTVHPLQRAGPTLNGKLVQELAFVDLAFRCKFLILQTKHF